MVNRQPPLPEGDGAQAGDIACGGVGDAGELRIRPATRDDLDRFYPGVGSSFKAWAAETDGEAWGIIGFALTRPYASLFSTFKEEYRPMLGRFAIWRLIRKVETEFKKLNVPVLACADPDEVTSPALLTKMGLVRTDTIDGIDLYVWRGG